MTSRAEKGAAGFEGLKLLLCENPLPPIDEAVVAAQAEVPRGNFYTEAYSAPLRCLIGERLAVPERLVHINAGSELILRQLFDRLGEQVHLLTPTYALFPEIARRCQGPAYVLRDAGVEQRRTDATRLSEALASVRSRSRLHG
jgi:histidinol-phosphate aminotransferase